MQYALMIYAAPGRVEAVSDPARLAARAEFSALARDARIIGDVELLSPETATCVRVDRGRVLTTDGPFADTKEVLGGVLLVEAADIDDALAAARIAANRAGGVVEVRPVRDIDFA